eukprot:2640220-Prymnesium_polylepis.1
MEPWYALLTLERCLQARGLRGGVTDGSCEPAARARAPPAARIVRWLLTSMVHPGCRDAARCRASPS